MNRRQQCGSAGMCAPRRAQARSRASRPCLDAWTCRALLACCAWQCLAFPADGFGQRASATRPPVAGCSVALQAGPWDAGVGSRSSWAEERVHAVLLGGALLRLRGGKSGESGKETQKESGRVEKRSSKGAKAESAARATPDAAHKSKDKSAGKVRKKERQDGSEEESGAAGTAEQEQEEHGGDGEKEKQEEEGVDAKKKAADESLAMLAWREGAEKAVS
ncbi:hypothetical protein T484DRAFT_3631986 [Baffinella frigidus]|nr:hypothetical protein T484DRAFT_3631986 [Cryptophyta sp. CCMP2293]